MSALGLTEIADVPLSAALDERRRVPSAWIDAGRVAA